MTSICSLGQFLHMACIGCRWARIVSASVQGSKFRNDARLRLTKEPELGRETRVVQSRTEDAAL